MNYAIQVLEEVFKDFTYKKSKKIWYIENDFAIAMCEYQKSRYSNHFFINIGILYKKLLPVSRKKVFKVEDCHLIARYSSIFKDYSISDIRDESFEDFDVLKKELKEMSTKIELKLFPILDNMIDANYMQTHYKEYPNDDWWMQNIMNEEYMRIFDNG